MKKLSLALIAASSLLAFACDRIPNRSETTNRAVQPKPSSSPGVYLFSAQKDGKTSYVFGTIHLGVRADSLPRLVFEALDATPFFANEDGKVSDGERTDREKTWQNWERLASSERDRFASLPVVRGDRLVAERVVNSLNPDRLCLGWTMLSIFDLEELEKGVQTLDSEISEYAARSGRTPVGLDNEALTERQGVVLEKECREKVFARNLSYRETRAMLKKEIAQYRSGKLKFVLGDADPVLAERNRSWIPTIEDLHEKGGVFAVVGAAHLGGRNGILTLLQEQGFEVRRMGPAVLE